MADIPGKTIEDMYLDDPLYGDLPGRRFYHPCSDTNGVPGAMTDEQVSNTLSGVGAINNRLLLLESSNPTPAPGVPIISSFIATVTIDSLIVDLSWLIATDSPIDGWSVKENDTTPLTGTDPGWIVSEIEVFTLSDFNPKTLTGQVRAENGEVSVPVTITVTPIQTTLPNITLFSIGQPPAGSRDYTVTIDADGAANRWIVIPGDNTPPLPTDPGWSGVVTFPITNVEQSLPTSEDTTVYAYVMDDNDNISPREVGFVRVTAPGGDTDPISGDLLWQNDPAPVAYTGQYSFTLSDGETLTIDGRVLGHTVDGSGRPLDELIRVTGSGAIANGADLIIENLNLFNARRSAIFLSGLHNTRITIRNNDFGDTNYLGEVKDTTYKGAISVWDCDGMVLNVLGNRFNRCDGGVSIEGCRNSAQGNRPYFYFKHNWGTTLIRHTPDPVGAWVNRLLWVYFRSSGLRGEISQNIWYCPNYDSEGEDLFNFGGVDGTPGDVMLVTRNRIWGDGPFRFTNAAFQIGDSNPSNRYTIVTENTIIDWNTPAQISAGNHNEFSNNKCYTSEARPSVGQGFPYQHQRCCRTSSPPGTMYNNTVRDNHVLHFHNDNGTIVTRAPWLPRFGTDQLRPNEGQCVATCDDADNVNPAGWNTNNWSENSFSNGQGKAVLWRKSWETFVWAGPDGLSPTINYDSPWIGDGGGQEFVVSSATNDPSFGHNVQVGATQIHNVVSLGLGGETPYQVISVTNPNNCTISVDQNQVIFTAGSVAGPGSYNFTLRDAAGNEGQGTVSFSLVDEAAEPVDHYDQNGSTQIVVDVNSPHEQYDRNGYEWLWTAGGGQGAPDSLYMQNRPYSGNFSWADAQTLAAEIVFRVWFDGTTTGDHMICANGMALASNYNECWVAWNQEDSVDPIRVPTYVDPLNQDDWNWDAGGNAGGNPTVINVTGPMSAVVRVLQKKGGFALGKLQIRRVSDGLPSSNNDPISPQAPHVVGSSE